MNPQILEYIRVQRAAGNPDETIVQNLRSTGWPEEMITQALKEPHTEAHAPSPSAAFRSGKHLLSAAIDTVRAKLTTLVLLGAIAGAPSIVGSFSKELTELAAGNGATLLMLFIAFIVLLIGSSILSVISTIGIATVLIHRDRDVSFQEAFQTGLQKFFPFAWVLFLSGFIEMGGFLLLIIPGMIFTIWFCFSYFVYLAEGSKGMDALLRSREYARGYGFQIVMRFGFLAIMNLLVSFVFGFLTAFIPYEPAQNILGYLLSLVITPISVAYGLFMYEDLRAIKGSVEHTLSKRNKMIYLVVACLGFVLIMAILIYLIYIIFQAANPFNRAPGSLTPPKRSVNQAFEQANDTKRKSDISALQQALTEYEDDEDQYPAFLDLLAPEYIREVPREPEGTPYEYTLIPGGDDYRLCTTYTEGGRVCVTSTTTPAL